VAALRMPAPGAYALSAALHAVAFLALVRVPAAVPPTFEEVQVEVVEVARPGPPPEPAPPPPRRAVHATPLAPPRDAPRPPAPVPDAPPPPNVPPPDDAPPPARAPVRIGISMSSSTTAGGVPAPAGNTAHGEMPGTAPEPGAVKPYRSEKVVPPSQVTVLPRPLEACYRTSPEDYPETARRLGVEARVPLVLTVDETGAIVDARVVSDPGHGLGAAALASLKRHGCRFAPARRGGEAVATRFGFTVRFELP
jgi:periplasmic protein TonB